MRGFFSCEEGDSMIITDKREKIVPMFAGFEDSVLISYAEGRTGTGWCDDPDAPTAAVICAGDFYFTAGDLSFAAEAFKLAENNSEAVFMPAGEGWTQALLALGKGLEKTVRYRTTPPKSHDLAALEALADISAFPEYKAGMIDENIYKQALRETWSWAFVGNFSDYNDFVDNAFGCCITHEGRLICAASCYSAYSRGVEVEIATHPDHRRKGLATAAGAALVSYASAAFSPQPRRAMSSRPSANTQIDFKKAGETEQMGNRR